MMNGAGVGKTDDGFSRHMVSYVTPAMTCATIAHCLLWAGTFRFDVIHVPLTTNIWSFFQIVQTSARS